MGVFLAALLTWSTHGNAYAHVLCRMQAVDGLPSLKEK